MTGNPGGGDAPRMGVTQADLNPPLRTIGAGLYDEHTARRVAADLTHEMIGPALARAARAEAELERVRDEWATAWDMAEHLRGEVERLTTELAEARQERGSDA